MGLSELLHGRVSSYERPRTSIRPDQTHPRRSIPYIVWTDAAGNFGLFGGEATDEGFDHLWRYTNGQWTWVAGSNTANQKGVYGILGVPAASNNAPERALPLQPGPVRLAACGSLAAARPRCSPLRYRPIHLRRRSAVGRAQLYVVNLANHRHPGIHRLAKALLHVFADGILAGPVLLGELAIDDDHELGMSVVGIREEASTQQTNAERRKVIS